MRSKDDYNKVINKIIKDVDKPYIKGLTERIDEEEGLLTFPENPDASVPFLKTLGPEVDELVVNGPVETLVVAVSA